MGRGTYLYEHTDLAVGSSPETSLAFMRMYDSARKHADTGLGRGWMHNFQVTAIPGPNAFQALGEDSALDAATALAALLVDADLLAAGPSKENLLISAALQQWLGERLGHEAVVVTRPDSSSGVFVPLPGGGYNPPNGMADTLIKEGDGTFLLTLKGGAQEDFDAQGRMISRTEPDGNAVTLTYGTGGELETIANSFGRTLTLTWTGGRVSQVSDGVRSVSFGYDAGGDMTAFTDAAAQDTTYTYVDGGLAEIFYPDAPASAFVANTYDALDRVMTQTEARGKVWNYYFSGLRSEEVDPLGNAKVWTFDPKGRPLTETDAVGETTAYAYDWQDRLQKKTFPEGNAVAFTYDARHNPVTETREPKPGSGESALTWSYVYHPVFDKPTRAEDPMGRVAEFTYDAATGELLTALQPQLAGGARPTTVYTYNTDGLVETVTDPENMVTRYAYDPATGDLLTLTVDHGRLNLQTAFTYTAVGDVATATDPRGNATGFIYDDLRRVTRITGPAPFAYVTERDWDEMGRLLAERRETGDTGNPWQTVSYNYTPTGKVWTVTNPENETVTYTYDDADRLIRTQDQEARSTERTYDPVGRLFQLIDGKSVTARELAYTPNGLTQSATDARGKVTAYAYDGHDRLSRVTYPDTTYEEYTYDDAGNVRFTRARDGSSIERGYDALNRVTARIVPGSGTDGYTYDLVGRIKTAASPAGTVQYAYDTAGRPQSVGFPGGRSVGYQLDAAGNTTRLTYPDTTFITYVYDEMNRMTAVKDDAGATLAGYAYDPLSRRTGVALANGAALTAGFDLADRPASLAHAWTGGAANLAYGYDDSGLRTSLNVDDPRFEPILPAPGQQDTFTVNDLNQYATFNGQPLTYNANGALTDDGTNTYTYDSLNRRITATTPSGAVSYTYDALDRRLSKTVAGTTTHFVYDGNQVIAEYDGAGALLRKYAYGPGIDQPVMMEQGGQRYYYHSDALGSVIALTDSAGTITETYRYEAFGEPDAASALGNPYMFTGRRYDPETGTYYYRARNYSPDLRRFMEPDPIGYVDGMNLYAYVGNSPVNFVDPTGLILFYGGIGGGAFIDSRYDSGPSPFLHGEAHGNISSGFFVDFDTQNSLIRGGVYSSGSGGYTSYAQDIQPEQGQVAGIGIGVGPEIGFFTGNVEQFRGKIGTDTYNFLGISLTASWTQADSFWSSVFGSGEWGLSAAIGGDGFGVGRIATETYADPTEVLRIDKNNNFHWFPGNHSLK